MLKGLKNRFWFIFLSILLGTGCNSSFKNEGEFLYWLNQIENGYLKRNSANGFSLSLKYLPPEYLAYLEVKKGGLDSDEKYESLFNEFNKSRTFLFTIEHQIPGVDATNYNIQSVSEFKERVSKLNFQIKEYIFFKTENGKKFKPVLTTFENLYEIGGKKTFYIVFSKVKEIEDDSDKIDIVFEDPFFETGINHFVFDKKKIKCLPELLFIN
ncbi:hypothetical protein [uncultured Maribacter sp.]|uniref:hypothetical protein n=1 Tax=uncultured Maribacter sp. TaxID=431308 RepID=UPI00261B266A|nr:hypothetical protein [uncultured Maribacter sp.]